MKNRKTSGGHHRPTTLPTKRYHQRPETSLRGFAKLRYVFLSARQFIRFAHVNARSLMDSSFPRVGKFRSISSSFDGNLFCLDDGVPEIGISNYGGLFSKMNLMRCLLCCVELLALELSAVSR